jgi:hypothetical protein
MDLKNVLAIGVDIELVYNVLYIPGGQLLSIIVVGIPGKDLLLN